MLNVRIDYASNYWHLQYPSLKPPCIGAQPLFTLCKECVHTYMDTENIMSMLITQFLFQLLVGVECTC